MIDTKAKKNLETNTKKNLVMFMPAKKTNKMLSIRRTNKIIRKLTHRHFTNCKKNLRKVNRRSVKKNNKSNASATGTEQIVDFLYAILSFYSSERQQNNKTKKQVKYFKNQPAKQ